MISKQILISIILLFFGSVLQAQTINPRVIGASGGNGSSVDADISWTIGEPVINIYSQPGNIITQGFHQSFGATAVISLVAGFELVCEGETVSLQVDFTGISPWSISYTDGTTSWEINGITDNPYEFDVDEAPVWSGPNPTVDYTYTLNWVSSNGFVNTGSGSAEVTVSKLPSTGPMYHIPNL